MRRFLFAISLLVFMPACSRDAAETRNPGGDPPRAHRELDTPQPATATGTAETPSPTAETAKETMQSVHLIEYAIHMPQTLTAGKQAFHVENGGKETHSFAIEGNGIEARLPSDLSRGNSGHLEVNLPAGTYTAYCPVANHRQRGMETTVTVK